MINQTPPEERPRERCLTSGPHCLSLRECLALILGSGPPGVGSLGLATQILNRPGEGLAPPEAEKAFFMALEVSGSAYLNEMSGLGPAGQAKILAAFEIGRRYSIYRKEASPSPRESDSLSYLASKALTKISAQHRNEPQEWLGFVPVHRSGRLGELCLVERGVRTHVNIDPAELFARILALRPRGFFLFHNHPSGQMSPSLQDLDLTERVRELSNHFGILLFGHWIVAPRNEHWIQPN